MPHRFTTTAAHLRRTRPTTLAHIRSGKSNSCSPGSGWRTLSIVLYGETARFEFGRNWKRFLESLTEQRIQQAAASLIAMLGFSRLDGKSFLDIGCGSGLFSLAARRLGAQVCSIDFDPESVACARGLRCGYFPYTLLL